MAVLSRIVEDFRKRSHSNGKVFSKETLKRMTAAFAYDECEAEFLKALSES